MDAAVGKTTTDRLAHLGRIGTALLAQQQRLGHRADRDADDHLVGQLGELAGTMRPDLGGAAQRRKDRRGAREIGRVAARHDGQRTLFSPYRAARNRCIQVVQAHGLQPAGVLARLRRHDGRHVDQQGTRRHRGRRTLLEQHIGHHRAVSQQRDDKVGARHRISRAVRDPRAICCKPLGLAAVTVPDADAVAGLAQAARHRIAHHADAEHGDAQGLLGSRTCDIHGNLELGSES
jgi:hypothetical protein